MNENTLDQILYNISLLQEGQIYTYYIGCYSADWQRIQRRPEGHFLKYRFTLIRILDDEDIVWAVSRKMKDFHYEYQAIRKTRKIPIQFFAWVREKQNELDEL